LQETIWFEKHDKGKEIYVGDFINFKKTIRNVDNEIVRHHTGMISQCDFSEKISIL